MDVSRQTFQNIIKEARNKVAKALVEGREIIIQGGNYNLDLNKTICRKCKKKSNTMYEKCRIKKCMVENFTQFSLEE